MPPTRTSDPYSARREAGRAQRALTSRRLLESADELFTTHGYAGTSVAAIAQAAGVSLPTLYLAWGSKRALLRAATDAAASASVPPQESASWRASIHQRILDVAGQSPYAADYLRAFAHVFAEVARRTGPYWRINRDAAATDPEVAADWTKLLAARRSTMAFLAEHLPRQGLRPDLDTQRLVDTLWLLAGPDVYELNTLHNGQHPEAHEQWLAVTLVAALTTD